MTTKHAIKLVDYLNKIRVREKCKYGSTPLYDNLIQLDFDEFDRIKTDVESQILDDKINKLINDFNA